MKLQEKALEAAYAAVPADKRDKNLIASAIRAYLDAQAPIRTARGIILDYPPGYPGGFDGPTGAE